jgi:lysophospholipase I
MLRLEDEPGILRSRDYFNTLIKAEIDKGIPAPRIVLGGFSQGGAMALFTAITSEQRLAGAFGLSCYLPLSDRIRGYMPSDPWPNNRTPFFIGHGVDDNLVPHEFGQMSKKLVESLGAENVEFHSYPYAPYLSFDLSFFLFPILDDFLLY